MRNGMQFEWRRNAWWGVTVSVAVHALLLAAVPLATRRQPAAPEAQGALLQVALLAAPRVPPPAADASFPATGAAGSGAVAAAAPVREAIRYFRPEELERQLMLLRDPAADQAIEVPHKLWLELFVDRRGRVAALTIHPGQGAKLAPRLEAQVRAAFMQLEFLPALRAGKTVPAYLRIELAGPED